MDGGHLWVNLCVTLSCYHIEQVLVVCSKCSGQMCDPLVSVATPATTWTASSRARTRLWWTSSSSGTGKPSRRSSRSPARRRTSMWWRRTPTWTGSWRWGGNKSVSVLQRPRRLPCLLPVALSHITESLRNTGDPSASGGFFTWLKWLFDSHDGSVRSRPRSHIRLRLRPPSSAPRFQERGEFNGWNRYFIKAGTPNRDLDQAPRYIRPINHSELDIYIMHHVLKLWCDIFLKSLLKASAFEINQVSGVRWLHTRFTQRSAASPWLHAGALVPCRCSTPSRGRAWSCWRSSSSTRGGSAVREPITFNMYSPYSQGNFCSYSRDDPSSFKCS